MDLCWVAAGRFDGFYEHKLEAWDSAAGYPIVEEAGGKSRISQPVANSPCTSTAYWPPTEKTDEMLKWIGKHALKPRVVKLQTENCGNKG